MASQENDNATENSKSTETPEPFCIDSFFEAIGFEEEKHLSDIRKATNYSDDLNLAGTENFWKEDGLDIPGFLGEKASSYWNNSMENSWSLTIEGNSESSSELSYLSKGAASLKSNQNMYILRFFCGLNNTRPEPLKYMLKSLSCQLVKELCNAGISSEFSTSGYQDDDDETPYFKFPTRRDEIGTAADQNLNLFFKTLCKMSNVMICIIIDHISCYYEKDDLSTFTIVQSLVDMVTNASEKGNMRLILTCPVHLEIPPELYGEYDKALNTNGYHWPYETQKEGEWIDNETLKESKWIDYETQKKGQVD